MPLGKNTENRNRTRLPQQHGDMMFVMSSFINRECTDSHKEIIWCYNPWCIEGCVSGRISSGTSMRSRSIDISCSHQPGTSSCYRFKIQLSPACGSIRFMCCCVACTLHLPITAESMQSHQLHQLHQLRRSISLSVSEESWDTTNITFWTPKGGFFLLQPSEQMSGDHWISL